MLIWHVHVEELWQKNIKKGEIIMFLWEQKTLCTVKSTIVQLDMGLISITLNLGLRRWSQGNQEFKVIFSYTSSLGCLRPDQKQNKNKQEQKQKPHCCNSEHAATLNLSWDVSGSIYWWCMTWGTWGSKCTHGLCIEDQSCKEVKW